MPRKTTSFADLLFQAPWWVSVITSAITYLLMGHLLPSIETDNQLINMVFKALAVPAPYFAIFILLIAPFSFFNAYLLNMSLGSELFPNFRGKSKGNF